MSTGGTYEVVLRKKKWRFIPKKILRHKKIRVNERYSFNASIWIADTPSSNLKPTVNLTLQHNGERIRLCFDQVHHLMIAVHDLREFILDNAGMLHDRLMAATGEFLEAHKAAMPAPPDDYTVYTVIQDSDGQNGGKEARVDTKTGEIFDEKGDEWEKGNGHSLENRGDG